MTSDSQKQLYPITTPPQQPLDSNLDDGLQNCQSISIDSDTDDIEDMQPKLTGDDTMKRKRDTRRALGNDRDRSTTGHEIKLRPPSHQRPLANEIVALIIHQLDQQNDVYQCTLVNQQFYAVANRWLWQSPTLNKNDTAERFIASLTRARSQMTEYHLRQLTVSGTFWNDHHFSQLVPHLCFLKDLQISAPTTITDISLQHLPRQCRHLESLSIAHCPVTPAFFDALGQHCRQLGHLTLLYYPKLPNGMFQALAHCPLKTVEITFAFTGIHPWWGGRGGEDMVQELAAYMQDLTRLKIHYGSFGMLRALMTTQQVDGTPPWPRLSHLNLTLGNSLFMDDAAVLAFIQWHPDLVALTLIDSSQLTDAFLDAIAGLPSLTCLHLSNNPYITPAGVRRLIGHATRLSSLTLETCRHISNTDFPQSRSLGDAGVASDRHDLTSIRKSLKL